MRPTRIPVLLMVPILAIALVACAGSSPGASTDGGGQTPTATAEPSTDNGGGGDGGGDAEQVAADLEPPNSSQISQTKGQGTNFTTYESTDSPDSLKNFYENAIPQTGMQVLFTSNASGTYSWLFGQSDSSQFGGSVTVGPASDGGSGASVVVIVSDER